jgi:hypothetical protein
MTEDEKRILELSRRLESKKCRDGLIVFIEGMIMGQNGIREQYGLVKEPPAGAA